MSVSFNDPNRPPGPWPLDDEGTTQARIRAAAATWRESAAATGSQTHLVSVLAMPGDDAPGLTLEWGSTFGPSVTRLHAWPFEGHLAIVHATRHPSTPSCHVAGVVDDSPDTLCRALGWLFLLNASGRGLWLLTDLPDFVAFDRAAPATPPRVVAGWFKTAHERAAEASGTGLVNPLDEAERLRRLSGLVDRARLSGVEGPKPAAMAFPPTQTWPERSYRRWLDVVSEPAHVKAMKAHVEAAWVRLSKGEKEN